MTPHTPVYSSTLFEYDRATNTFLAEASTLQHHAADKQLFGRVDIKDANDVGFAVVSAKTGDRIEVALQQVAWTEEHEIAAWRLVPTPATKARLPNVASLLVTVINT